MNTPDTYLLASETGSHISWLTEALQRQGRVEAVPMTPEALDERIAAVSPRAVFVDFCAPCTATATTLHRYLRRDWPAVAVLGLGTAAESATLLTALRTGVDDFVDMAAPSRDVPTTLAALLERRSAQAASARGRTVALLGALAALGTTTLAASLALLMQDATSRAALLDLGLPARDGLLYLDTQSTFSFVDGVHNLRRLDQTLLHTALAHHAGGAAVLPLPSSLAQVREISHADSAALIRRLNDFFDWQFIDLGGFTTIDFLAQTVAEADRTWVVCDQGIGSIVSTAGMLRELEARGIETQRFSLVVNKLDPAVALSARDIAARLRLPLAHVLPMRRTALLGAACRGEMLVRTTRNDPYTQAVTGMTKTLQRELATAGPGAAPAEAASSATPAPARPRAGFMTQIAGIAGRRAREN